MREPQRRLPVLSSKSEFRADVTTVSHEPQAANQGHTADSSVSAGQDKLSESEKVTARHFMPVSASLQNR